MLTTGVALVGRWEVIEPAEDERPIPERLERHQRRRELEPDTLRGRPPVEHIGAIPDINGREPRRAPSPGRAQ